MAKISIIVPVYNVEKYLRKSLKNDVGQSLQSIIHMQETNNG